MTTLDVPAKPWYKSKQIWTAILSVVLMILGSPEVTGWIQAHPEVSLWIGVGIQTLQVIFRSLSERPVVLSAKTQTRSLRL